jgi:methylamine---glutamate N-methyltransferase subunit A
MCGIVGFLDKTGRMERSTGPVIFHMLEALGCRGPDGAGVALIGPETSPGDDVVWSVRIARGDEHGLEPLTRLGQFVPMPDGAPWARQGSTLQFRFAPESGVTATELEQSLGARRGGLEVLCVGRRLDLVKQVGSPSALDAVYGVSSWYGPLAIGHTRLSTESRIDLSHSQPFWAHGTLDLATVHNGHVTNYHQLRRHYEQRGVTFYTDNDSEIIGVFLRDRLEQGFSLKEAMADSISRLDGAFNYLVASSEGLGVVRDRFGFKPLMLVETDEYVAVATEEIALRRALAGTYRASEPPPGACVFYPSTVEQYAHGPGLR